LFEEFEEFEVWMCRIMERFDMLERKVSGKEKSRPRINGELLYDNQDLCFMMNISKRALQCYRSSKQLNFKRIDQKTYYLESDVQQFIRDCLKKPEDKNVNVEIES